MAKGDGGARPLRKHQAVASQLAIAILSGEYQPGDSLDGEIEQSLALGVSRTAYREAMRTLVAKGLIESRPKAGTHVTPRHRWNLLDPDMLAWMFARRPDEHFVRDLFELRGIIEPAAAALAAQRRTQDHLDIMAEALAQMGEHGLSDTEGQEANRRFHRAILQASGNEALASLSSSVGAAVQWTTHYKHKASKAPRDPLPEHIAVYAAIEAADPVAATHTMTELLHFALADMANALP